MKKKKAIPQTISIPVYYHIDEEGVVVYDLEQMTSDFELELSKLDN